MMLPEEKEVDSLLGADARHRYAYFIERVCEARKVWGLFNGGWATLCEGSDTFIPFWPHPTYAERFRTGAWHAYQVKEIELSTFMERWIPGMKKDGIGPAIFPVSEGSLATISVDDLEANLRCELKTASEEAG